MKKYPRRRLMDGLQSMLTSLGERVSAINYTGTHGDIADRELLAMYKHSWMVKKFIDKTADDKDRLLPRNRVLADNEGFVLLQETGRGKTGKPRT
ncbi:hypothetical protein SGGMMB4_05916 (plasmid) [Sodalis glossinidius str. 'morsitans']|uniref:Uncharacterized protein n=1 Tax=Sodalis glossinidius (strain morsitans) TaxID=343509 RepID=A0A193QNY9_SODGM|nr:hypothetical protein [Sodalis glossinidius]CRL46944.1 hypothetical protein SGGMMB4_05916 [Sodalis glossinidius str. 'morsitans']